MYIHQNPHFFEGQFEDLKKWSVCWDWVWMQLEQLTPTAAVSQNVPLIGLIQANRWKLWLAGTEDLIKEFMAIHPAVIERFQSKWWIESL